MSKRIHYLLIDDIDGSVATETITLTLDGVSYVLDLNADHAASLREAIAGWTVHARRLKAPTRRRGSGPAASSTAGLDLADVRRWARESGYEISDRGRIPGTVLAAYQAA
jgi:hypothetical protein